MTTTSSNEKLSSPVNVRLSPKKHFLYQSQDASLGKSYSSYLRERLESQDILFEELRALSHKIETLISKESSSNRSIPYFGLLVEILLLLRSASNPNRLRMIHAKIEQQGLTVWDDDYGSSG